MKIIARHKKVIAGAVITESCNDDDTVHRYTATIRGWRNWVIYEGKVDRDTFGWVVQRVREIRDRIDEGDDRVFIESVSLGDTDEGFDYDLGKGKRIKERR